MPRKMCPKKNAKKHGKNHPSRDIRTAWSKELNRLQKQCGRKAEGREENTHISFRESTGVVRGRQKAHKLQAHPQTGRRH